MDSFIVFGPRSPVQMCYHDDIEVMLFSSPRAIDGPMLGNQSAQDWNKFF